MKLKRVVYELGGFAIVFSMFLPSLVVALLFKETNILGQYTPVVALFMCALVWLIISFNFHKVDPLMKKWRILCGVKYEKRIWHEWS